MNILLVEDDERIAEFLVRGLHAEGHRVEWVTDGAKGYDAARQKAYDAIILDLMLPEMDGREVCQKLRANGVKTKILMLTALETTDDVVRGLRMGADDYLTKPFAFDELVARLEVLGRSAAEANGAGARTLVVGALHFDTDALSVTYDGKPVELTSLEYALLEFLMSESGRVVSRARILQNVWGAHQDPLTNIVDVYVKRLRSKLAQQGAEDIITTIRGRGYRLNS